MTLLSILVGLLVSTLAALTTLTTYRMLVVRSVEGSTRATQDGHMASGTLTAQMELQSAGFGIGSLALPALANTDLVVLSQASWANGSLGGTVQTIGSSGATSGNAVVWGARPLLTSYECSALLAQDSGLMLLRGNCTAANQWAGASWQKVGDLIPPAGIGGASAVLRAERASCWPFAQAAVVPDAIRVTLWNDESSWKSSVCLPAIKAPST